MDTKNMLQKNNKYIKVIIFLVFLAIIGFTYAYFLAHVGGNSKSDIITISGGKIELTYFDGNEEVVVDQLIPGETIKTKTFSVKNTGTHYIEDYDVILDTITNQLKYKSDLVYTLTCKEYNKKDEYVKDCIGVDDEKEFPSNETKLVTNGIEVNYTHKYELVVKYLETYQDQSDDMDKIVKGRIGIVDDSEIYIEN